jgi:hypothetical protein
MYACRSYRPNRSVPADHDASSGNRELAAPIARTSKTEATAPGPKHLYLGLTLAFPERITCAGRVKFDCRRAASKPKFTIIQRGFDHDECVITR